MLQTLDVVIAFAVIMTVLSLFITILVQMVSAFFSLRGKNLANALSLTFQTIDPHIGDKAHSLAAQILRDPIFSDSIWRNKNRKAPEEIDPATKALIEAEKELKLKQQALAKKEALQADVDQAEEAVKVAKAAAKVPPVTPNRMEQWSFLALPWGGAAHLGNAIRPGEIYRVLNEFADMTETEAALKNIPADLVTKATALIAALREKDRPTTESQKKLILISQVSDYFKANPQQQLAVVNSLANFGTTVERATTQAYDRFQRWFGSGQDRAEQWFQTHIRIVTIVMAALTAIVLQLDTVEMYRRLREQPKLVEALVKSAPNVLAQGATVLDPTDTPAYHTYLLWLQKHPLFPLKALPAGGDKEAFGEALADRLKQPPNAAYPLEQFDNAVTLARTAAGFTDTADPSDLAGVEAAYKAWLRSFPALKLDSEPDFATATATKIREDIQKKIEADTAGKAAPDQETARKWLTEYEGLQADGALAFEKARRATFENLRKQLEEAGFDLAPTRLFGRWDKEELPSWGRRCPLLAHYLIHSLGVAMTAGLLALGAPFWFNLLKNLMSLRPAVAALIEKRPTSAPALPASPKTPPSSS